MSESTTPHPVARVSTNPGAIASQLVGVWTLVSFVSQQDGLDEIFPFGPKPEGFLIYTSARYVSAHLMKPGRSLFQSRDWQQATASEFQDAGSGYIGYRGVYAVDEERARNRADHSPVWANHRPWTLTAIDEDSNSI
jgi:hypothetical protein